MKTLLTVLLISSISYATCKEENAVASEEVVYTVATNVPSHLKGATIVVKLADGRTSEVSAEKFMVVPRKQKTVLGENKTVTKKVTCSAKEKKNIVMLEAEKEVSDLDTTVTTSGNTISAKTKSEKTVTPGLNYYRRQVLDTNVGLGLGVDTNGYVKGMIGLDF